MASLENQNDELGVPLSVVGRRPSGRNPVGWIKTMRRARQIVASPSGSYAECLVLEFGSCHAGDVEHLMRLAAPEVGVLTAVEATHLETYGTLEAIEREEGKVVTMLPSSGVGIVNVDSPGGVRAVGGAACRTVTYGFDAAANVRGGAVESSVDWGRLTGSVSLSVQCDDERGTLRIEGTVGSHSCYAPLAALGVASAVGIPFGQAVRALRDYTPPEGRMRCEAGLSGAVVIDDTYNSSPAAAMKALDTLAAVAPKTASGRRIAVLGPMAELGPVSRSRHEDVGRHVAILGIDHVITIGDEARTTAGAAREAGMPAACVLESTGPEQAIRALRQLLEPGDVLLVKGSQSARLDRVAKALTVPRGEPETRSRGRTVPNTA